MGIANRLRNFADQVDAMDLQAKKEEMTRKAKDAGMTAIDKATEASAKAKTTKSPIALTPEAKGKVSDWRNAMADRLSTDS